MLKCGVVRDGKMSVRCMGEWWRKSEHEHGREKTPKWIDQKEVITLVTDPSVTAKFKAKPRKNAAPLSEAKTTGGDTDEEEKSTAKKPKTGTPTSKKKGTAVASKRKQQQKQVTQATACKRERG